jgi:hypothetical protein
MKKIILVLILILMNSFGDNIDNFMFRLSENVCNVQYIKDYIEKGVDKNIDMGGKSLLEHIKSQNNPDCDEVVKYLKSIGAVEGKEYVALKQKRASEALDKQLRNIPCGTNIEIIEELIKKGANINQVNENGDTLFTIFAWRGLRECNKLARYLSSIGVKDSGYTFYRALERYKYDTPKVFETKHLKVTVLHVTAYGSSEITFENKTDEPIVLKSQTTDVNGNKRFIDAGNYTINPYSKFNDYIYSFKGDKAKMPKVVNNKVNLTRQATFKYTYKGKEYELKTPVIKDEIDIIYDEGSLF